MDDPCLIVVGAGPKGIALGAKVSALRTCGLHVPRVRIFDHSGVAANWTGTEGEYTNGRQRLASSPLKDVGFPYASKWGDAQKNAQVDKEMLRFSWPAYLIARRTMKFEKKNYYATWVDRGEIVPLLSEWAGYLEWVAMQSGCTPDERRVKAASKVGNRWEVVVVDKFGIEETVPGDGLVVTGPGGPKALKGYDPENHPPIATDARNFWKYLEDVVDGRSLRFGVIGAGGAAASVAMALLQVSESRISADPKQNPFMVDILTPDGVVYSRGESYDENRHYSDPQEWIKFSSDGRRKFNEHTSAGVFSLEAKQEIGLAENLYTKCFDVADIKVWGSFGGVSVYSTGEDDPLHYDRVINATGFDGLWWIDDLLEDDLRGMAPFNAARVPGKRNGGLAIGDSLELRNFDPPLHLPMLAEGQGPGFPSLMCLGLMSDRILRRYVR
ncbi:hypothetical protein [Streptomyces sp. NPDC002122]|uniref:hypothetical protein n=1 Tax=Streptomyces sp. NPDC002122 TaxID=3154407 RepID=UPI00331E5EE9